MINLVFLLLPNYQMTGKKEDIFYYDYLVAKRDSLFPYGLLVPKKVNKITNEYLFDLLFKFLSEELPELMRTDPYANASSCLSYHHLFCELPRFDFVRVTKKQYQEKINVTGISPDFESTHRDILQWFEEHELNSAIYDGIIRVGKRLYEKDPEIPRSEPGVWISTTGEPASDLEAFQRLKFYGGQIVCEYWIKEFERKYINPDQRIYQAGLDEINIFIGETAKLDVRAALKHTDQNWHHEYLRITHNFYLNHRCESASGGVGWQVYGKYIWYKEWLEKQILQLIIPPQITALPTLEPLYSGGIDGLKKETFELITKRGSLISFLTVLSSIDGQFWYDLNDDETTDSSKVVRISHDSFRTPKRATQNDFPELLERYNITGTQSGRLFDYFREDLIKYVETMISYHKTLYKPEEKKIEHYEVLGLGEDFLGWLKDRKFEIHKSDENPVGQQERKGPVKLKVIAMLHYYKDIVITKHNMNLIAEEYGWKSGQKIYTKYNVFRKRDNRLKSHGTETADELQLDEYEWTISLLGNNPEAQAKAIADKTEFLKVAMVS